jgi:type II secretory ATPase GspE/PulE/Tfp pilus assembly ATPase PilB-like protein
LLARTLAKDTKTDARTWAIERLAELQWLKAKAQRATAETMATVEQEIREAILARASSADIKNIAIKNGMTTMFDDGLKKVEAGLTTLEEVLRVIHE